MGHVKGEHDGAQSCMNISLSKEELKHEGVTILENAKTIVQWCNSTMGPSNIGKSIVSRYF